MNIYTSFSITIFLVFSLFNDIYSQLRESDKPLYSYASTTPDEIEDDVSILTNHLIRHLDTDKDKAKVIFFWIAQNIEYDLEAYYEDIYFDDYQETLDRKRGICKNYTSLFKKMCDIAGIECYEISGYGKGYNFEKGNYFEKVNHSWNAIRIDSSYYLCDVTWGSGIFESEDYGFEYAKRVNMRYFL